MKTIKEFRDLLIVLYRLSIDTVSIRVFNKNKYYTPIFDTLEKLESNNKFISISLFRYAFELYQY